MLNRKTQTIAALIALSLVVLACNALLPQGGQDVTPVDNLPQAPAALPQTEDDVPRVTVEEARAALDSGQAVILDVRSVGAYEAGHIPGAIHIPVDDIEADPGVVDIATDEWIITYCT